MQGVKLRKVVDGDAAFIMAVLTRQMLEHSRSYDNVVVSAFFVRAGLDAIFRSGADIVVACSEEHPEVILGFVVGNAKAHVLWYVYVKEAYRREGISVNLIEAIFPPGPIYHALQTPGLSWLASKFELVFDPTILKPLTGGLRDGKR